MKLRRSVGPAMLGAMVALTLVLAGCSSSDSTPTAGSTTSETTGATTSAGTGNETGIASGEPGDVSPGFTKSTEASTSIESPSTATTKPASAHVQDTVLDTLPGSKDSGCIAVGNKSDVRSGGLAAGNFMAARKQYAQDDSGSGQPSVSMYVIPRHSKPMSGVKVAMKPITGSGDAFSVTSDSVETANDWKYYSLTLSIPSPGTWRMTAVAGPDRGCFDVTFKR